MKLGDDCYPESAGGQPGGGWPSVLLSFMPWNYGTKALAGSYEIFGRFLRMPLQNAQARMSTFGTVFARATARFPSYQRLPKELPAGAAVLLERALTLDRNPPRVAGFPQIPKERGIVIVFP